VSRSTKLRAVLALGVLLIAGVLGASESIDLPTRGEEAFRAPWQDGAKVLRVETLGAHHAIVTISPARIVDARTVTRRGADGSFIGEYQVLLLADEFGVATTAKPTRAWWDRVLGIERGAPRERMPAPRLPSAADRRSPGGAR